MVYTARLVTITEVKSVSQELLPFIRFRAMFENVELRENEKVAVLRIEGTDSFLPVFIERGKSMKALEQELKGLETEMDAKTRDALKPHLGP